MCTIFECVLLHLPVKSRSLCFASCFFLHASWRQNSARDPGATVVTTLMIPTTLPAPTTARKTASNASANVAENTTDASPLWRPRLPTRSAAWVATSSSSATVAASPLSGIARMTKKGEYAIEAMHNEMLYVQLFAKWRRCWSM